MGLSEHARRSALAEVETLWALAKANPEYRPAGLMGGLGVLRGLLSCGVTPEAWDEIRGYFEEGGAAE